MIINFFHISCKLFIKLLQNYCKFNDLISNNKVSTVRTKHQLLALMKGLKERKRKAFNYTSGETVYN